MTHLMPQGDKTEHILTHVSGTEQDKADLKKALDTLKRTQIGRDILSQVPKDIHYVFEETHPSASGTYSKPQKTITLYREHMTEETPLYITLAHEMRHAVQDQNTLLRIDFINQKDEAIVAKLCELDTKVHDILLEHQTLALPENQNKTASAPAMFYTALYAQGKKSGFTDPVSRTNRHKFPGSRLDGRYCHTGVKKPGHSPASCRYIVVGRVVSRCGIKARQSIVPVAV